MVLRHQVPPIHIAQMYGFCPRGDIYFLRIVSITSVSGVFASAPGSGFPVSLGCLGWVLVMGDAGTAFRVTGVVALEPDGDSVAIFFFVGVIGV